MDRRKSRAYMWKREVLKGGRRKSAQKGVPKELRLLCRIYNKSAADMIQLLPLLVDEEYPMLNYELHLLLATVVSNYIESWYPKLNLDDTEFVREVYLTMTKAATVVAFRIKSVNIMTLVNQLAAVITEHMKDVEKLQKQQKSPLGNVNCTLDPLKVYLKEQHQIFADIEYEWLNESNVDNMEDTTAFGLDLSVDTLERDYLRLLSKSVLDCTFDKGISPMHSKIVESLLVAILGDLVLKKALDKLSDPDFIYDTLGLILSKWDKEEGKQDKEKTEIMGEAKEGTTKKRDNNDDTISIWQLVFGYFKSDNNKETCSDLEPILTSTVFQLLDQVINFSARRPLAYGIIRQLLMIMSTSKYLDHQLKKIITQKLLSVLLDQGLSEITSLTTSILFNLRQDPDNNKFGNPDEQRKEEIRKEETTSDMILRLAKGFIKIPGENIKYFQYSGENELDLLKSVAATLSIFSDPTTNRALIIKLIDSLICSFFPELINLPPSTLFT